MLSLIANILYEMWRGVIIIAASVVAGGLYRIYEERKGKLPPMLERDGPPPGLALVNLGGAVYIAIDITRNFGDPTINAWEAPLASIIIVGGAAVIGKQFLKNRR